MHAAWIGPSVLRDLDAALKGSIELRCLGGFVFAQLVMSAFVRLMLMSISSSTRAAPRTGRRWQFVLGSQS
jgi:hypothetical protein